MNNINALKLAITLLVGFAGGTASAAAPKIECWLVGENPTIPGRYDQQMWRKTFKAQGEEKHFLLLNTDGKSVTDVPVTQIGRGADVSAIKGQTVVEIKRFKKGAFGVWATVVEPSGDPSETDGLQLRIESLSVGPVTKSIPLYVLSMAPGKPHFGVACQVAKGKGSH